MPHHSGQPESWEQLLSRRVRTLARTGPLHRLEDSKASRTRNLEQHDLRALALRAIDSTIEHMGLGYGANRQDLHQALDPLIRTAEPALTSKDVTEVADAVIEHLLNEPSRRRAFDEPYMSFDGSTSTRRSVRFHLLREEEADDGTIVVKATTEAINFYAGMLDVDVEDAQTAAEAVLRAQVDRGAIGAAVATARQARLRSIEYAESLRSTLRQVRRDVARVDAQRMLATIASARGHRETRLQVERGLLDTVEERVAVDDGKDASSLVELRDALSDCRQRHLKLHEELLTVNETWLAEQEVQRFRRVRASALPDLEREVFHPLVAHRVEVVAPLMEELLPALHGPAVLPAFDLAALVSQLLAPRRREAEQDLEVPVDVLEPLSAMEARFAPEVREAVEQWLARGGTLGGLLEASRQAGEPPAIRRLLVLRLLWAWDPDGREPFAVRADGPLNDLEYGGQDLRVGGSE
jgi:hypothetical protein